MCIRDRHICDAVTTSVRRENLIHVAKVLAMAWGTESDSRRMVLCCENVEGVGAYFHSLLMDYAKNEQQRKNLSVIRIPDTIVDRICAAGSTIMEVTSESFHECSVDADVVTDVYKRQACRSFLMRISYSVMYRMLYVKMIFWKNW